MIRQVLSAVALVGLFAATVVEAAPDIRGKTLEGVTFPERVTTIDGKTLDVAKLAKKNRVVVVTLKATWCTVCQHQLRRIQAKLPEAGEGCGVTYLVLAPGPRKDLQVIQEEIEFPYPFIEDTDLEIADRLGLRLAADQIWPAILILEPDLSIGWAQRGRSGFFFGDPELMMKLDCLSWI